MKKILIAFSAIIICAIALIYFLIPHNFIVATTVYTNHKPATVLRCLQDNSKWMQWFPGRNGIANLCYNNQQYHLGEKSYTSINVLIKKDNLAYPSVINVLPLNSDSSAIQWVLQLEAGNNLLKRIKAYQTARILKNSNTVLLNNFKTFIQSTKNIYGFDIKYTTLTDTTLVSIKTSLNQYPSTDFIYSLIDKLKAYIKQQSASEHNYPMLNVTQLQDSSYSVMVGIPTNIPLNETNVIKPKRMMMIKDKTLLTEVVGDTSVIKKALHETSNYMHDYELTAPVIPFQQLVTDRRKVKDSTKWVTLIFSPIS